MCLPKAPDAPALSPVATPSLASASGLAIGGAGRGAAQIGRLKLRTDTSAAKAPTSTPLSAAVGLPTGAQNAGAGIAYQNTPNSDLRIPIDPGT